MGGRRATSWPESAVASRQLSRIGRLRHALGETRSLVEAPGCLCDANDQDDGLSILLVNCLFLWDCWLLGADGSAVFLSHDQVVFGLCAR
jgi:hypothetical protein